MKLELKHIQHYPIGNDGLVVKIYDKHDYGFLATIEAVYINRAMVRDVATGYMSTESFGDIKPILRPLSDLTKEIEHNGEKFVPEMRILRLTDNHLVMSFLDMHKTDPSYAVARSDYVLISSMFEWHFDLFDLIENNQAIDINTLD